ADRARNVPTGPVSIALGGQRRGVSVDVEGMETAVAVEDQATAAVRQERKVSGDVKTPIVRASVRRFIDARRAVRMEAAVAIEHEARLRCVGARLCFHGARDAAAGPIRGGG